MTRRPHPPLPPLVIAGHPWRHWITAEGRIVTVTLPLVNFGQRRKLKPSIVVTLKCRPRGRYARRAA